jgi:UDP-N-acetylmuramoylalanine--D-glutamate ligase
MVNGCMADSYNKALVLGLGASGVEAAKLLMSEGTEVTAVDATLSDALDERKKELLDAGAEVQLGCNELPAGEYDLCVVSPGISASSEWVETAERRMPVISELELGASRCECPIVAVTGTNGKSTMVKLCGDAFERSGRRTVVAGNYGTPVCAVAKETTNLDVIVLEVSSFQLEKVDVFSPRIGVLLNIQPDHLDRHGNMDAYMAMKARLFGGMQEDGTGIVLSSELQTVRTLSSGENKWISFGLEGGVDFRFDSGAISWTEGGEMKEIDIAGSYFDNSILGLTAAAGAAVLKECGVEAGDIADSIMNFEPLPHRMENVGTFDGIRFVDDSKATNLTAMLAGLEMAGDNVRLIAGGQLKEKSSDKVKEVLAKRVKTIYLIGEASVELKEAWSDAVDCRECGDLRNALRMACSDSSKGEIVLLSPGCASFDQFENYKDRGRQFKQIIQKET